MTACKVNAIEVGVKNLKLAVKICCHAVYLKKKTCQVNCIGNKN